MSRQEKQNVLNGDQIVQGDLTVDSGVITTTISATTISAGANSNLKVGGSGANFTALNVIRQVIDYTAINSGNLSLAVHTPFTSGVATLIGSGDYIVPLSQPAESGVTLLPAVAASAATISVRYVQTSLAAIDPAAQEYRFLVIRGTVLSN